MEIDIKKFTMLLRQGDIVPRGDIAKVKVAVNLKNKGKKMTPRNAKIYNEVSENIIAAILNTKPLYSMARRALKKQNENTINQAVI